MKALKISFFKRYNALIGFLLSLLGFGAVSSLNSCMPVAEYGVPFATFKVNGSVESKTDSKTLPNIRVVMDWDTTYTDNDGKYHLSRTAFPDDQSFLIEFEDIDGEANGEYQALDTIVEFINPEFSDDSGNWDEGETEITVNVKLENKE